MRREVLASCKSVVKNASALKKQTENQWVCICRYLGCLLAKRFVEVCKDRPRDTGVVASLRTKSWENRQKRFLQLLRDQNHVGDVQVEKPGTGSNGADKKKTVLPPNRTVLRMLPVLALFCVTSVQVEFRRFYKSEK